jgi:hypothetical protein
VTQKNPPIHLQTWSVRFVLGLYLAIAPRATAQAPAPVYAVAGQVLGADAAPLEHAQIRIEDRGGVVLRILQSDSVGRFLAERLSDAPLSVHVRALGYAPRSVAVKASSATHRVSVTIQLERVAAELAGVPITEEEVDHNKKLAAYRDRKANNSFAHFIDGDDIERRKPQFVSEMFRTIGGVTLKSSDKLGNVLLLRGCAPLVWVDGVRMPGAQLDEVAPPDDIAGIEIYNSFAGIPARYFDRSATCGTILVWLRT